MPTRPDSPATVVVTGGTGTVGRLLVHHLAGLGLRPRVLVRDGGRARALFGDDADVVVGSLAERPVVQAALTGASALFLACGNVPGQVELENAAIDAAGQAGVRRVVKHSARGTDPAAGMPGPVTGQILEIFAALRSGAYATTTDTVPRVTGRPAGSFAAFARDHAAAFTADLVNR